MNSSLKVQVTCNCGRSFESEASLKQQHAFCPNCRSAITLVNVGVAREYQRAVPVCDDFATRIALTPMTKLVAK